MSKTRVFVGGIRNPKTTERDLEKFFDYYGRIEDCRLKVGFGFVNFEDERDARDAVDEADGKNMNGDRLTVEFANGGRGRGAGSRGMDRRDDRRDRGGYRDERSRRPPPVRSEWRLLVENVSSSVSWQDLKDFMRKAGEVNYADAHKPKNEGVIEYADRKGMENALETLDGAELAGLKIKLTRDKSAGGRGGKKSRSRSRSSSRSRSRSPRK